MIIHNATIITFDDENRIIENGAVRYAKDEITAVVDSPDILTAYPDD